MLSPDTLDVIVNSSERNPRIGKASQNEASQDESVSNRSRALDQLFGLLEQRSVGYCILHGHEKLPHLIDSDIDILVDRSISHHQILNLLLESERVFGFRVVRARGLYFVLAGKEKSGTPFFIELDFCHDVLVHHIKLLPGEAILGSRRRPERYWVPSVEFEFASYAVRTIGKLELSPKRTAHLTTLYRQNPQKCREALFRAVSSDDCGVFCGAIETGNWNSVRGAIASIKQKMIVSAALRFPFSAVAGQWRSLLRALNRSARREGLSVAVLGPDGAGKSSIIDAMRTGLAPVFPRTACWGFAPSLRRLLGKKPSSTATPHALPPRSLAVSLVRVAYWSCYYALSQIVLIWQKMRGVLVMYDRHFVDILVDSRRYRYGGPIWLVELLSRCIRSPDLTLLLDAPAEVLQRRKQEVPFEVTAQQRQSYLRLIKTVENGMIIDCSRPLEQVSANAIDIILGRLADKVRERRSGRVLSPFI